MVPPGGVCRSALATRLLDHLLQPAGIGQDLIGVGRDGRRDPHPGGPRLALVAPDDVLEHALDGEDARFQRRGAVLVARQVEQVGDDPLEAAGLVADGLEVARAGRGVERHVGHRQRVEIAAHRGERRAQFVRHVGEHLAAHAVGFCERVGARGELGRHPVEGAGQAGDLVVPGVVGADGELTGADPPGRGFEARAAGGATARKSRRRRPPPPRRAPACPAATAAGPTSLNGAARRWRREHHQPAQLAVDLHRGGDDRTGRAGIDAGGGAAPASAAAAWARIAGLSGAGELAASRPSFIRT